MSKTILFLLPSVIVTKINAYVSGKNVAPPPNKSSIEEQQKRQYGACLTLCRDHEVYKSSLTYGVIPGFV